MSCEIVAPLAARYRDQFPVTSKLIYMNHAGVAPLCRPAAEAMQRLAADALEFGSLHYDQWLETYDGVRQAAARLIHSQPQEIAIVKNTSEGIATVASGLDWRPGDKIVAFREEFPANYLPWMQLERTGIQVEWLSVHALPEEIDRAVRGARLLAVSFVQYLSGYRINLHTFGEICRRHGCLFLVDAIQGLGAFPVDVREASVDALAADGHKWLLGPEGCGILYIRKELQDQIRPVEFGWTNVATFEDYGARELGLRQDAGRYECGTLNTIGCYGLRAAIEFLLQVGVPEIGRAVLDLVDSLAEGIRRKGYRLLGERTPETGAGILCFQGDRDSRTLVRELREHGIVAAPRQGWVRISPHFYVSPEDGERFLEALPAA